jgi:uncharacterized membrane protein YdfJ with MMPL/SSD domain
MENKKIILLSVILIFSQIMGIPGIYKVWTAIIIGLLLIVFDFRRSGGIQKNGTLNSSTMVNEEKQENNFS